MTDCRVRRPAAFLDRDGVVNVDRGYVFRREDFEFVPGVLDGARSLSGLGYALVVVTNQSGIGRGMYSERDFGALTEWMKAAFEQAGAPLEGVYYCPHHPTEASGLYRIDCDCRKPRAGMLLRAAQELGLDLPDSIMFGDRSSDLQAAKAAGVGRRILLATDGRGEPSKTIDELATGGIPDSTKPSRENSAVFRQTSQGSRPDETSSSDFRGKGRQRQATGTSRQFAGASARLHERRFRHPPPRARDVPRAGPGVGRGLSGRREQ